MKKYTIEDITKECRFTTSRSSGAGGQHVNKVETKVMLKWNIASSSILDNSDKELIISKLSSRINKDNELIIIAQESKSQLLNKEEAINKLEKLLVEALKKPKERKPTRPTKASVHKRLENKKKHGEKKKMRKDPE